MIGNCRLMYDERWKRGMELFNEEEFFECHEVLEDLWLTTQDGYKDLYKGIIQSAVALYHLERGNLRGAEKLCRTSRRYLVKYPLRVLGLNLEKLCEDMKTCFEFKEYKIPKLDFTL